MIWKVLIAAVAFIGLCVIGMCFNIIFRRGGKFPETDISSNPEMKKRGIVCAREEDAMIHGEKGQAPQRQSFDCGDCTSCDLYKINKRNSEKI